MTLASLEWMQQGRCAYVTYENRPFSEENDTDVRPICRSCPVAWECLTEAITHGVKYDKWGGMAPPQRDEFQRRFPTLDGTARRSHRVFLSKGPQTLQGS